MSCGLALVLDQLTKFTIFEALVDSRRITLVPGVFSLAPARNTGVVWGLLDQWPLLVLVVGLAAAALVLFYFYRYSARTKPESVAWGLILGGAIGNLIDRATVGHVKDFIEMGFAGWSWPTFNVADACITIGACIIIGLFLFGKSPETAAG